MPIYLIFRRHAWPTRAEVEKAAGLSSRAALVDLPGQVRWIRSYLLHEADERLGLVCVFQSPDRATLREHARCAGLPVDEIVPVAETIVLLDDPQSAA